MVLSRLGTSTLRPRISEGLLALANGRIHGLTCLQAMDWRAAGHLLVVGIALHGRRVYTHRELRRVCTDVVRDMYEHLGEIGRIVCGDATMDLVAVCAQLSYARGF